MRPKCASGCRVATNPYSAERDHPGADPDPAAVLAHALPDQPGATDLGDRGQDEQHDRADNGHGASVDRSPDGPRDSAAQLATRAGCTAAHVIPAGREQEHDHGDRHERDREHPAATPGPRRPRPHRRAARPRSRTGSAQHAAQDRPASPAGRTRHHRTRRAGGAVTAAAQRRRPARRTAADSNPFPRTSSGRRSRRPGPPAGCRG